MPVDKNQKIQAHPSPPPNTTKPSGPSVPSPLLWLQDARNFGSAPLLGCWLNTFWLRRPPIHTKKIADLPLNTYIYIYMLYCIRSHFASSLFLSSFSSLSCADPLPSIMFPLSLASLFCYQASLLWLSLSLSPTFVLCSLSHFLSFCCICATDTSLFCSLSYLFCFGGALCGQLPVAEYSANSVVARLPSYGSFPQISIPCQIDSFPQIYPLR